MGKTIFILGGSRSGKSRFAIELAKKKAKKIAFIATGEAKDSEMKERILLHRRKRPDTWKTFEEPRNVLGLLEKIEDSFEVIMIDCLTLLISNFILKGRKDKNIAEEINKILAVLKKHKALSIIISNEVGLGIVPGNQLARRFRDIAGRTNQLVAQKSNEVYFMVSGIPWRIK